jgi:hypothetical protein
VLQKSVKTQHTPTKNKIFPLHSFYCHTNLIGKFSQYFIFKFWILRENRFSDTKKGKIRETLLLVKKQRKKEIHFQQIVGFFHLVYSDLKSFYFRIFLKVSLFAAIFLIKYFFLKYKKYGQNEL